MRSGERAGERGRQRLHDAFNDCSGLEQDLVVPEAKHFPAMTPKPLSAQSITLDRFGARVATAIELDDQLTPRTREVGYPRTELMLAPEGDAECTASDDVPEDGLCVGLVAAKVTGLFEVAALRSHAASFVQLMCRLAPLPDPLPARGERELPVFQR